MALWVAPAAVHPTVYARDNVAGTARWVSTAPSATAATLALEFVTTDDEAAAAAFRVALPDIHKFVLRAPLALRPVGSVEVHTHAEDKYTLFFPDSAYGAQDPACDGRALVEAVEPYTTIVASRQEPGLFLVHPSAEARAHHLTPRFADDAVDNMLQRRAPLPPQPTRHETFAEWAQSKRLSFLTQLSYVTRGARASRHALLEHPIVRRAAPLVSASQAGPYMVSAQRHDDASGDDEFDAARVYLAKWARQVAEQGELHQRADAADQALDAEALLGHAQLPPVPDASDTPALDAAACEAHLRRGTPVNDLAQLLFHAGLTPDARQLMWPYMLGAYTLHGSPEACEEERQRRAQNYADRRAAWHGVAAPALGELSSSRHRIWIDCLRADTKHALFHTPLAHDAEAEMQRSGWLRAGHQGASDTPVNPHLFVLSDVLLTFAYYAEEGQDAELPWLDGYVQGMSDLCLVCYVACGGHAALTFWTFTAVMRRWGDLYVEDQSGMRRKLLLLQRLIAELCPALHQYLQRIDGLNLFFCFRWLLVGFKREFSLDGVLRLWDAIWAASWCTQHARGWPLCTEMELFIALAMLEGHAPVLARHLKTFDEVLMYIHSLALHMDAASVLRRAEALVYRLRSRLLRADAGADADLHALVGAELSMPVST